jgi:hypothetical protein
MKSGSYGSASDIVADIQRAAPDRTLSAQVVEFFSRDDAVEVMRDCLQTNSQDTIASLGRRGFVLAKVATVQRSS